MAARACRGQFWSWWLLCVSALRNSETPSHASVQIRSPQPVYTQHSHSNRALRPQRQSPCLLMSFDTFAAPHPPSPNQDRANTHAVASSACAVRVFCLPLDVRVNVRKSETQPVDTSPCKLQHGARSMHGLSGFHRATTHLAIVRHALSRFHISVVIDKHLSPRDTIDPMQRLNYCKS